MNQHVASWTLRCGLLVALAWGGGCSRPGAVVLEPRAVTVRVERFGEVVPFEVAIRNGGKQEVVASFRGVSCSCITADFDELRIAPGERARARFAVHMERAKGTSQAVMLQIDGELIHVPVHIELHSELAFGPSRAVVNLRADDTLVDHVFDVFGPTEIRPGALAVESEDQRVALLTPVLDETEGRAGQSIGLRVDPEFRGAGVYRVVVRGELGEVLAAGDVVLSRL